jgi:hypothetical protein
MGKMKNSHKILVGSLKGRDHAEDLDADGRIILKWTGNSVGGCGLDSSCSE